MSWIWSKHQPKKSDEPSTSNLNRRRLVSWAHLASRRWTLNKIIGLVVLVVLAVFLASRFTGVSIGSYQMLSFGSAWPSDDPVPPKDYLKKYFALEALFYHNRKSDYPKSKMNQRMFGNLDPSTVPLRQALVFTTSTARLSKSKVGTFFSKQRIPYYTFFYADPNPTLVLPGTNRPLFSIIMVDDYLEYLNMPEESKAVIDDYCRRYSVGILAMTKPGWAPKDGEQTFGYVTMKGRKEMKGYMWNPASSIWRVAKTEAVYEGELGGDWTVFSFNHRSYQPLVLSTEVKKGEEASSETPYDSVVAFHDIGQVDRIEKIVFGNTIDFWLNTIAAMDAATYLSHGRFQLGMDRFVQLDIENMFVGQMGLRTKHGDANYMLKNQQEVGEFIPGIKYALGYSAGSFDYGTPEETKGAKRVVELGENFAWVNQFMNFLTGINKLTKDEIVKELKENFEFAKKFKLPVLKNYVIPPRYEGVYPVHEDLYSAFNELGINVTSTDVYPHVYAEHEKRGFMHRGVKVMPRWSLGVPRTDFNFISDMKHLGGKKAMDHIVKKGEFFKKFLFYPVLLLNSRMTNFANDRLGEYSIEHATRLATTYTNLRYHAPEPATIVDIYFEQHPDELQPPIWQNPCDEDTHKKYTRDTDQCLQIPDVYIVGPPMTGASTLSLFMSVHPHLFGTKTNKNIQFFEGPNYAKGLEWYTQNFPKKNITDGPDRDLLFELNTEYFTSLTAPERMAAMNPEVKVIITTVDPISRAYAWYLYCKSKELPSAVQNSFYQVITAPDSVDPELIELRDLILLPGLYANNLARYIVTVKRSQVMVVDGDALTDDPASTLHAVQRFLGVRMIDFETKLKYSEEMGTYCTSKRCATPQMTRSLEDSPPMEKEAEDLLKDFYKGSNEDLKAIFTDILKEPVPLWLEDATSELNERKRRRRR